MADLAGDRFTAMLPAAGGATDRRRGNLGVGYRGSAGGRFRVAGYVVLVLRGGAPVIGVLIGSVAMVADVFTIRRFFAIDHKWRWYFATIVFGIMCLLSVLLVQDVLAIVDHLTA